MKTSALSVFVLSFGLLTQGSICLAADPQPSKVVPKTSPSTKIPSGASLPSTTQLYKPIASMKISKSSPPKVLIAPSVSSRSDAIPTFDPIDSALGVFKRAVGVDREAHVAFSAKAKECWDKDYTQADQAAAGCSYTETVASCYEKLATACVTPTLVRMQAATTALTDARKKLNYELDAYKTRLNR